MGRMGNRSEGKFVMGVVHITPSATVDMKALFNRRERRQTAMALHITQETT